MDSANFPATHKATLLTETTQPARPMVRSGAWFISPFAFQSILFAYGILKKKIKFKVLRMLALNRQPADPD